MEQVKKKDWAPKEEGNLGLFYMLVPRKSKEPEKVVVDPEELHVPQEGLVERGIDERPAPFSVGRDLSLVNIAGMPRPEGVEPA